MRSFFLFAVVSVSAACGVIPAQADGPALTVPEGFEANLFATDEQAHDIHSLTFDAAGQLVVSGPGYIRRLKDIDGDGKADHVETFADAPASGAQGLFFLGPHLMCAGDNALQIFRDDNRDGKADGDPEVFLRVMAGREHDAHAIRKGPDGWWYIIAGNMAGISAGYASLPTSPVRQPESGTLLRLKPDLSGGEIIADGLRNAYDFDFSPSGDIFTFDSDGERDISLPWYEPTRVFQLTPRSHAGWVSRSWKHPDHYPDMPPVTGRFGRGSPSGVVCYRHTQFPEPYRGALFVLDWTFGRVLALPLQQNSSVWSAEPIEFATSAGQYGFAPTDAAVSPNGDLYISIGGRGTQGGVFRISATNSSEDASTAAESEGDSGEETADADDDLQQVLTAVQPGASWSRASWLPKARRVGPVVLQQVALDAAHSVAERRRAIEVMTELFNGLDDQAALALADDAEPLVRARAIWSVGRARADNPPQDVLTRYLQDTDPLVVRAALEALSTLPADHSVADCLPALAATLSSTDTWVRAAAATAVARLSDGDWQQLQVLPVQSPSARVTAELGRQQRLPKVSLEAVAAGMEVLRIPDATLRQKLDACRLLEVSLGDTGPKTGRPAVFDSCASRLDLSPYDLPLASATSELVELFPTGDDVLDHELLRVLGMLAPLNRDLLPKILSGITAETSPADDIHRLIVLAQIEVERTFDESTATAAALVNLDVKIHERSLRQDANWDDRIGELYKKLCEVDPAIRAVIVDQAGFGRPGHVLFLSEVGQDKVPTAIDKLATTIQQDDSFAWSNNVVFLLGESDKPEHQQLIRDQLDNRTVRGAVLMVLSETPRNEDRELYMDGLGSAQINVVKGCLEALIQLPPGRTAEDQFALLSAARRLIHSPEEFKVRERAMRLLQNNTSQSFGFVFGDEGHRPQPESLQKWDTWFREKYPEFRTPGSDVEDINRVLASLDSIDWEAGDAARGEVLFQKLACAKCHGGRRALGPDLQGVAKRFSRDDLIAAIVDPSRDVSPRYQTTSVTTTEGRTYTGLIVYESVDGLLLRDAEHQTWRIEASEIEDRIKQPASLMPSGLLKDRDSSDLADLYLYLQGL